ncbi:hypothetical protein [Micromonospora sp. NPDC005413]|uniref:hypothetical protein n=1 Tax=Micromonospora sp. NPDC005413 TaxID=3154563 RepID=UPI0033A8C0E9
MNTSPCCAPSRARAVPGLADYAATKAGLVGYTRGVAHDLARRGITGAVLDSNGGHTA